MNSYKRLVPGYEAPTTIAWSEKNRSPLVRVPATRGAGTRIELRMPDPSCNPYLALAVMLRAGLDGIEQKIDPGPPVNKNIYKMSHRERRHLRIDELPGNLSEALDELEKDDLVRETLGEHIFDHFLDAKREEWFDYIKHVSPWEIDRYLGATDVLRPGQPVEPPGSAPRGRSVGSEDCAEMRDLRAPGRARDLMQWERVAPNQRDA